MDFRIGYGFDVHQFANDRKLILAGIEIPHEKGLLGILMQMFYFML